MAELSVLIVNYNTWRECAAAIASLRQHRPTRADGTPMPFECIVVDNLSPRRSDAEIAAVERELRLCGEQQGDPAAGRLVLHTENGGYSKGMNLAFGHSRGRWILVSNPDVVFTAGLIDALLRHLERNPGTGCAVPKGFWDPGLEGHLPPNTLPTLRDVALTTLGEFSPRLSHWYRRRLQKSWVRVWTAQRPVPLPMMSGCLFLIGRDFFDAVGRFDERYPLYYEDTDLSLTIRRAGRAVVQVPDAHFVHLVNRSGMTDVGTMTSRHDVSRALYYRKWYGRLGAWTLAWSRWLLRDPRLARWKRPPSPGPVEDLGESVERPVIRLPRHCDRYLLLLSLDARGYLSGGMFGRGQQWTPSDTMWSNFACTTYFFEAIDLSGGRFETIGRWRFRSLSHLGEPMPHAATPPPGKAPLVAGGRE
ncbi:MAG: glycosyltransferase family 2 protein [Planctomycetes bacterium]|nr:glycosyltransferase family 2 protein [Planctomycetota bacterium]